MSAIGIIQDQDIGAARHDAKTLAIGSHAAYRPLHSRTQSPAFRDMPWETRMKPLRPWNELGTYAFAAIVTAGALTFALT